MYVWRKSTSPTKPHFRITFPPGALCEGTYGDLKTPTRWLGHMHICYLAHKQGSTEEAGPWLHKTIWISVRQPTVSCIFRFLCQVWYESSKDMWMIFITIQDVYCNIGYTIVICHLQLTSCSSVYRMFIAILGTALLFVISSLLHVHQYTGCLLQYWVQHCYLSSPAYFMFILLQELYFNFSASNFVYVKAWLSDCRSVPSLTFRLSVRSVLDLQAIGQFRLRKHLTFRLSVRSVYVSSWPSGCRSGPSLTFRLSVSSVLDLQTVGQVRLRKPLTFRLSVSSVLDFRLSASSVIDLQTVGQVRPWPSDCRSGPST